MAKVIKNIVVTGLTLMVSAAAVVFGKGVAETVWENGLGNKVAEKSHKLFSKKKED